MSQSNTIKTLAKVMIAAAWADGSIANEEINSLKDLLFQLPEMTASDWAELEIYFDSPVGEAERARLVADLQGALTTSEDKSLALRAVDELVDADGEVTDDERAVAEQIKAAIQDINLGVFGKLGKLMGGSLDRRSQALKNAPNRELYLDDFEKNKIYYNVCRRLELEGTDLHISEKELRRLSLAGGLMARVAYVDRDIQDAEFETMVAAIQGFWGLPDVESNLVAEVAASEIGKDLDFFRMSREFFLATDGDERLRFLDVLFAVADGDDGVSYKETEEIRAIANGLKLTHKQFIDAKLKIPRDRRGE